MAVMYDLPLEELKKYQPALTKQPDFEEFWERTKAELAEVSQDVTLEPRAYPVDGVKVYQLSYNGFGGARIRGWYAVPDDAAVHPGLVIYHGYNHSFEGGIHEVVNWALHGYAAFGMLVRGQQDSEDTTVSTHGHQAGWMSKGILDKDTYYYRGVYMDAMRAIEVLSEQPNVNPDRIGVTGASQGGGLTIAAAALSSLPHVAVADYPYLSNFRRAIDVSPTGPYLELNEFFRRNSNPAIEEQAMRTLSYFDVMNLAAWVTCPTMVSIGLIDQITPPSTVFAAYNHLTCEKKIQVYRYFGHEFIPAYQLEKLAHLRSHLKLS